MVVVLQSRTGDYNIPYGAEVETKRHIVVYDSLTDRIKFDGEYDFMLYRQLENIPRFIYTCVW